MDAKKKVFLKNVHVRVAKAFVTSFNIKHLHYSLLIIIS